jgi:hypothetical protein
MYVKKDQTFESRDRLVMNLKQEARISTINPLKPKLV